VKPDTDEDQVPIKWEPIDVTPTLKDGRTVIPDEAIESIHRNYVALKGPLAVCIHQTSFKLQPTTP
jgi:isocitrate dehydrogenase (NAD+)